MQTAAMPLVADAKQPITVRRQDATIGLPVEVVAEFFAGDPVRDELFNFDAPKWRNPPFAGYPLTHRRRRNAEFLCEQRQSAAGPAAAQNFRDAQYRCG